MLRYTLRCKEQFPEKNQVDLDLPQPLLPSEKVSRFIVVNGLRFSNNSSVVVELNNDRINFFLLKFFKKLTDLHQVQLLSFPVTSLAISSLRSFETLQPCPQPLH